KIREKRIILAVAGGLLSFAVYGLIVDIGSVLMMSTDFSLKQIAAIYASGLTFNVSHGVTTAVILLVAGKVFIEKLDRIKIKYGMF
ncbi:MAG: ECF transporter S component, partial [Clostridia bacterium]|nr:ECF transporter S component [Clostridia bacterium]